MTRNQQRMKLICCDTGRKLAEQFAEAARVYAESVVALTSHHADVSWNEYIRLHEAVEEARKRFGIAYEEHVGSSSAQKGVAFSRTEASEATRKGRAGLDRDR
jgi:hypothetical protein